MKKIKIVILFSFTFLNINTYLFAEENTVADQKKSIAVVLEIKGDGHTIKSVNTFLVKVYEGIAKPWNGKNTILTNDMLIVKAYDEKGNLVYEGFYDNPLVETKETFTEDGQTAENALVVSKEGSINVRFPLIENSGNLTLKCFQIIDNQPEKLLTTINLNKQ